MRFDLLKLLVLAVVPMVGACGSIASPPGLSADEDQTESCSGYPEVAQYALPWAATTQHVLLEGNCGTGTNKGVSRYAYDFGMAVGTSVIAARAGTVTALETGFEAGNFPEPNYVQITHADGSIGHYMQLAQNGAVVAVGDYVGLGQAIALSGDTGMTDLPALHFEVTADVGGYWESIPVSFSNSGSAVSPLVEGTSYPIP